MLVGKTLRESGILQSMGSVGDPWDNALQESGIGTIKAELVARHDFTSRTQARLRIFDYIENFYNPIRAHSSLGMLSPDEYEAEYHQSQQAANAA
jgi:putative transposase